jgi:4-amino-4-deoxy-L-arabinose transferase-like glycosyltransferase
VNKINRFMNLRVEGLVSTGPLWTWFFFVVFVVSNGFLAYSSLPYQLKIWIFLAGILLPLVLYARARVLHKIDLEKNSSNPIISDPPIGIYLVLLGIGLFLRFFKLTDLHLWPTGDEGLQGFFAIELVKKWDWRFFYTSGQHPPLLIWILKIFFQLFRNPFFNLWFPPALLSSLTLIFGYFVSRVFFSKSASFIFFLLLAFSFWPLDFGRFCVQGALVPFFELFCFYFLGRFLSESKPSFRKTWSAILGISLGLGCLTFTSWVTVIVFVVLGVIAHAHTWRQNSREYFLFFAASFFIGFSPWLIAVSREGFGGYLFGVSFFSGFFTWKQQFLTSLSNFTSLFWGPFQIEAGYGPTWGGVLNPLLGGCFFFGMAELYRMRQKPIARALAFAFCLFLLPGFLAADHVEMFRIIPVMPILLMIVVFGVWRLLLSVSFNRRLLWLTLLIGSSFCIDFYHFLKPQLVGTGSEVEFKKSVEDESFEAFQLLKGVDEHQGPGLIFTEFLLLSRGHNLRVAVYPFNAADNPRINPDQATWASVIVNAHYGYFLAKRFPKSQWRRIAAGNQEDGGLAVGIIPLGKKDRWVMLHWLRAQDYVHRLGVQSENMMNNQEFYQSVVKKLLDGYPLMEGDPFLESIYGEWIAQYHYTHGLERNVSALQRAVKKGYPAANLYYKLGNFLLLNRQFPEAHQAYLVAAGCNPNYTNAQEILSRIWGKNP